MTLTITSPYITSPGAVWLKGNLHTHSTRSDGKASPQDVVDHYARLGHDFLAFSDHDVPPEFLGLDARGMLLIPCLEVSADGPHVLALGCLRKIEPAADRQKVIDAIRAAGGVAVMNHPNWEQSYDHCSFAELRRLTGYAGVEVYNGAILEFSGSEVASDKWDRLLALDRRVWGYAHDDMHRLDRSGRGWNVVLARERSVAAVLEALASGSFYASSGVNISRIAVEGTRVVVSAPDAEAIEVVGELGKRLAWVEGTELAFDAAGAPGGFFRFECLGRAGRMAWTQPFWLTSPEIEHRRAMIAEQPVLRAGRAARAPQLKGDLSAAAWRSAEAAVRFVDSGDTSPAPLATEVRAVIAGSRLLVGIRCHEPNLGGMKLTVRNDNDTRLWTNDGVEVFIAPDGPGTPRYFQLMANADGFCYAAAHGGRRGAPQPRLECRSGRFDGGWTLELAVPLEDLGTTAAPGSRWGFNMVRNRHAGAKPASCIWSFTGGSNHMPERFGALEL